MAYRKLCAVTFAVLGFIAVGCGGDTNANQSSPEAEKQPPSNADQPPGDSDQASNADPTPSNPDQASNNATDPAGTGGGGRLGALCQQLCSSLDKLADHCGDMPMMGDTKALCSTECVVPANILPCEREIADVFTCLLDNLELFCADANQQNPPGRDAQPAAATPCQDIAKTYTKCAEVHGVTDGDTGGNKAPKCSTDGGCDCPTACSTCGCEAGTDADALAACADTCAP